MSILQTAGILACTVLIFLAVEACVDYRARARRADEAKKDELPVAANDESTLDPGDPYELG